MKLVIERKYKKAGYTIGVLYVNGQRICNTLEPVDRGLINKASPGKTSSKDWILADVDAKITKIKFDKGSTAIPLGSYFVTEAVSKKFQGRRLFVRDVPGFNGIMIHEGNTRMDTAGCILVGENTIKGRVQKSKKHLKELNELVFEALRGKEIVVLRIM